MMHYTVWKILNTPDLLTTTQFDDNLEIRGGALYSYHNGYQRVQNRANETNVMSNWP